MKVKLLLAEIPGANQRERTHNRCRDENAVKQIKNGHIAMKQRQTNNREDGENNHAHDVNPQSLQMTKHFVFHYAA